jgi:hypothetical protein
MARANGQGDIAGVARGGLTLLALLVVLDRPNAAELIAFVLHDTFAVSFEEIGGIVDRSPLAGNKENCIPSRRLSGATILWR